MIDPASIAAGIVLGGGVGVIAGGLFSCVRFQEAIDELSDIARQADRLIRVQGREIAELRAEKWRINVQRRAAAAKGRAAQEAKRTAERKVRVEAVEQRHAMQEAAE